MKIKHQLALLLLIATALSLLGAPSGQARDTRPSSQSASLVYDEMRAVYLGNLARRDNGVPPLRWNVQMTEAARWFSWDCVENRPGGFCGHEDTLGRGPWDRSSAFGYRGFSGAENVFCGYVTPEQAIRGWMTSGGHRDNLLNPYWQEVGLGYYRRASDGRGYVTQVFGRDAVYPPLIIENEALHTPSPNVDLYVYDRAGSDSFAGLGPATGMMVSNDPCFTGATWEPYAAEKKWTLEPGSGWRTVYARTRDAVGRTTAVSDTIYLGRDLPLGDLGLHLAASTTAQVTVYRLDGDDLPYAQFSQNWFADDTHSTFHLWWGSGERVNDAGALGGSAFRLRAGDGEAFAWVWTTEFFKDMPLVAYFRLKVSDNTSSAQVARISVGGGGTEYGPVTLKGTDFGAANVYQEFPIPFTYHANADDVFLFFNFWRSGQAHVYVDGVYIFSAPQAVRSPLTWTVPGGNYRGGGVWLRYTDGAQGFSPVQAADLTAEHLHVSPDALTFLTAHGDPPPPPRTLAVVGEGCDPFTWEVAEDSAWLQAQPGAEGVRVSVDAAGLITGTYRTTLTVRAQTGVLDSPAQVPVTLIVAESLYPTWLPLILRHSGS